MSCIFPFRFNGKIYNGCTFDDSDPGDNRPWCSTKVDLRGFHIGGQDNWGFCENECPTDPDPIDDKDETDYYYY